MIETFDIPSLEPGVYQHYKGNKYEVLGVGCHTETNEYYVVYSPIKQKPGIPKIWLRPYSMFIEKVTIDGVTTPRFNKL